MKNPPLSLIGKKADLPSLKEKLSPAAKMENLGGGQKANPEKLLHLIKQRLVRPLSVGDSFGRLTIQSVFYPSSGGERRVICQCTCGASVEKKAAGLLSGLIKSCGCLRKETAIQRGQNSRVHGYYGGKNPNPLYGVWKAMISRCHNERNKQFKDYGGRGIVVCPEWQGLQGFTTFANQMGEPPSKTHSLDRKNNNEGYNLGNCQWATRKQQGHNKRNNQWVSVGGHHFILSEWERRLNLKRGTLHSKNSRLRKNKTPEAIADFINQQLYASSFYAIINNG